MSDALVQYKAKRAELASMLEKAEPAMVALAPPTLSVPRLRQIVLTAVTRQPALLDCDPGSIVRATMQAAELGLEIAGAFGEAYLVPFRNHKAGGKQHAQFVAGWKGYVKLALESGKVSKVESRLVWDDDLKFDYEYGTSPVIRHHPTMGEHGPKAKVTHAYAIAFLTDGPPTFDVMSKSDLDAIRNATKSRDFRKPDRPITGPWAEHTNEMYRKCPVRRLSKYLDLSAKARKLFEYDVEPDSAARHVGDIGPDRGDKLKAQLRFEQAGTVDVEFKVESIGAGGPAMPKHGH